MSIRPRPSLLLALALLAFTPVLRAQAETPRPQPPIPDVNALLRDVTLRQRRTEQLREDYSYTEVIETRDLDSKGRVKNTKTEEFEIFFIHDKHMRRLVKRNGKPLDPGEEKKEQDRVTREVEKASKAPPDEVANRNAVAISHIIENARCTHPRRERWNGRDTIVLDFLSNPHARTHSQVESAFKQLSGTLWIDENDKTVARLSARFDQDFHVGAGMVASVHRGSTMTLDQSLINHEIWLPVSAHLRFDARIFLFKGLAEDVVITTSNYHKFLVDSTQKDGAVVHPPA